MIDTAAITEWRRRAPWALLADELAFRGGTALHKLHLQPPGRYSEDLDFVQVHGVPIGPVLTATRTAIDPWIQPFGPPTHARAHDATSGASASFAAPPVDPSPDTASVRPRPTSPFRRTCPCGTVPQPPSLVPP